MRRVFLIPLVLFVIILTAGVYFLNRNNSAITDADPRTSLPTGTSESPSPTSGVQNIPENWQSYTSEEFDFMIRYPSDVQHETTEEGERFSKLGPTQATGTELFDGISVVITSGNLGEDDFETFVQKKYTELKNDPVQPRLGEMSEITLAGKNGFAFTVDAIGVRTQIYLPKGDDTYLEIINSTVEPTNREQTFQKTVDTMLSSLIYE